MSQSLGATSGEEDDSDGVVRAQPPAYLDVSHGSCPRSRVCPSAAGPGAQSTPSTGDVTSRMSSTANPVLQPALEESPVTATGVMSQGRWAECITISSGGVGGFCLDSVQTLLKGMQELLEAYRGLGVGSPVKVWGASLPASPGSEGVPSAVVPLKVPVSSPLSVANQVVPLAAGPMR